MFTEIYCKTYDFTEKFLLTRQNMLVMKAENNKKNTLMSVSNKILLRKLTLIDQIKLVPK